jgi:hypothetical protein
MTDCIPTFVPSEDAPTEHPDDHEGAIDRLRAAIETLDAQIGALATSIPVLAKQCSDIEIDAALAGGLDDEQQAEQQQRRLKLAADRQRQQDLEVARAIAVRRHDAEVTARNRRLALQQAEKVKDAEAAKAQALLALDPLMSQLEEVLRQVRQREAAAQRERAALAQQVQGGDASLLELLDTIPARVGPPPGAAVHDRKTGMTLPQWQLTADQQVQAARQRFEDAALALAQDRGAVPAILDRWRQLQEVAAGGPQEPDLAANDALNESLLEA